MDTYEIEERFLRMLEHAYYEYLDNEYSKSATKLDKERTRSILFTYEDIATDVFGWCDAKIDGIFADISKKWHKEND